MFAETTWTRYCGHSALATRTAPDASTASPARERTSASTACTRLFDAASSSTPLSQRRSRSKDLEAVTVVVVRRSRWLIVTDTDELIGVLSRASALPQYLITAMLVGDETVSWTAPSAVR